MPHYLVQAPYSTEAISNLVKNPQDRSAAVRALIERTGGRLEAFYYAFGDYDVVAIAEMPDNVSMAALSMAVSTSCALKNFKTTALIPTEEGVEALRKAGTIELQPPGR